MTDLGVQDDGMAPPTLADVMKKIRGTTRQATFAESVGLSSAMIGHVEAGSRSMSVESVEKIIRSLNLDAETAISLRRARDRMSGSKEPSIPAQIAKLELTLGRQLDRIEETVSRMDEASAAVEETDEKLDALIDQVGRIAVQVQSLYRVLGSYEAGASTLPDQAPTPPPGVVPRSRRSTLPNA